ncbi:probable serine protease inhibitor 42Dd [Coccomyxa sp. Obi]|nr:probable serine protease inhibitor 42Dd [Coccomyxa sp. Obi]
MPKRLSARAPVRATVPDHAGPQTPAWADLDALNRSNLRTAIELHRQVSRPHQNMVASPFNVQAALSMLYTGARDHTAKEMSRGLSWDLAPAQHAAACRAIRAKVVANVADEDGERYPYWISDGHRTPPATLHLAHRMWVDPSVHVETEFEDALALHFDSTTGTVDIRNAAAASERINSWPQPFTPDDEPPRPLRMMTLTEHFATHETRDYEAVDVEFSASALAMRLFGPKHGLAQLEATLREEDLSGRLGNDRKI